MTNLYEILKTDTQEEATKTFENLSIKTKHEEDLTIFKYDMLSVKWAENGFKDKSPAYYSRGHIYRSIPNGWDMVNRPFDKFFNLHETHCPISQTKAFNNFLPYAELVEKLDGSLISIWWDERKQKWRLSTSGNITSTCSEDCGKTFEELFVETVAPEAKDLQRFMNGISTGFTYLFELATEDNRIVTEYASNRVVILQVRNIATGEYATPERLKNLLEHFQEGGFQNIYLPFRASFKDLEICSEQDLNEFVENLIENPVCNDCVHPEGFVIYDNRTHEPVAKVKNSNYLQRHGLTTNGSEHTRNKIIESIFVLNNWDDISALLSESRKAFGTALLDWAEDELKMLRELVSKEEFSAIEVQKDYADYVLQKVPKLYQGMFFCHRSAVQNGDLSMFGTSLKTQLEKNSKSLLKLLKDEGLKRINKNHD